MNAWRKTLVYLGLVEEPEEHDEMPDRMSAPAPFPPGPGEPSVEPPGRRTDGASGPVEESSNVRPLARAAPDGGAHVRPMTGAFSGRVQVVAVATFDEDAAEIGRQYRMGSPVLFDMTDAPAAVARRVLDFVSGITFALRGRMAKVGSRAFLIVPEGVEVSAAERERLAALGYGGSV